MKYFVELGQNPELSLAELLAVYPKIKILRRSDKAVVFESAMRPDIEKLGGAPKIAEVIGKGAPLEIIREYLVKNYKDKKIFFGLSFYGSRPDKNLGKEIKRFLEDAGRKARWVISREPVLSSVIIKTNKLLRRGGDFCVVPGDSRAGGSLVAKTIAVQDFSDYEFRDIRRPARDLVSGMTPPKLAKIMINLGGPSREMFDPFCGSGTFLMEAALLGIKNVYGSDISEKAVLDSRKNINWLGEKYKTGAKIQIKKCDVRNAGACWKKTFGLIVCEPYLGPAIRGRLSAEKGMKLKKELEENYGKYLGGLSGALQSGGRLVMVAPYIIIEGRRGLPIDLDIKKYGLKAVSGPILYSRSGQKIGREIYILEKLKP